MAQFNISKVIEILQEYVQQFEKPLINAIPDAQRTPFVVLIATLLSLRTRDTTTAGVVERLFERAPDLDTMHALEIEELEKLIYPVGFFRNKARQIKEICQILLDQYDGRVPDELDLLLALPGVGRKTANLVLTHGYDKDGICVDIHVHRISNRMGYISTKDPEKTEMKLREILPRRYWKVYNEILVGFGQNLCAPVSPKCSICPVHSYCARIGVVSSR